VIELRMPALRDMREDIPTIASAILDKLAQQARIERPDLEEEAMRGLAQYDFPGNVRELENVLERALALCDGTRIARDDLQLTPPDAIEIAPTTEGTDGGKWPLQEYLDRVEKEAILEALEKTRYNRTAAAKLLGITFRAMRYRMERLGIN
jgi:two-component system response regulator PilR (NtrC family)